MYPILMHIWGPFSIHSYGCMIALGLGSALYGMLHDKLMKHIIPSSQLISLFSYTLITGVIGGRLLHILEYPETIHSFCDIFNITQAGFSLLGTVLACVLFLYSYIKIHALPLFCITDRAVIYMPFAYAIARIGCFLAGCCYGSASSLWWSITYTNSEVFAPCYIALHPAQLYSALAGFCIFLFFYFFAQYRYPKIGQLTGLYFVAIGLERFYIDFFRGHRLLINATFSISQILSMLCIMSGIIIISLATYSSWFGKAVQKQ